MIALKDVQNFSQHLSILYVEDNDKVREETAEIFKLLFAQVDLASNGEEGLEKYNRQKYDIVITDINMPRINGIEMIFQIREINPEQKIVAISAHDEPETLISMMRKGVSTFLLKPISLNEMLNIIYPVCRDASAQNMNAELFEALNEERKKYKNIVSKLMSHLRTVEIKNGQIEKLYTQTNNEERSQMLQEYFAKDEENEYEPDQILALFDAICIDLSLYVKRFAVESMAMKNIHHIHQPTTLSIQQIIGLIRPDLADDGGDMDFF